MKWALPMPVRVTPGSFLFFRGLSGVGLTLNAKGGVRKLAGRQCDCGVLGTLNRHSCPHIRLLRNEDLSAAANRGREWLRDDVQQDFAHLAATCSDRVSLLILQQVNLTLKIQWKDHGCGVHLFTPSPLAMAGAN
jgi:hypothetical protein